MRQGEALLAFDASENLFSPFSIPRAHPSPSPKESKPLACITCLRKCGLFVSSLILTLRARFAREK
ncbi:MAG: hypothetical protein ACR2P7_04240, partial [bacterium]